MWFPRKNLKVAFSILTDLSLCSIILPDLSFLRLRRYVVEDKDYSFRIYCKNSGVIILIVIGLYQMILIISAIIDNLWSTEQKQTQLTGTFGRTSFNIGSKDDLSLFTSSTPSILFAKLWITDLLCNKSDFSKRFLMKGCNKARYDILN